MMNDKEIKHFEQALEKIASKAREFGLDTYPMRFEICPADIIYTFGAYGMPTRYSHWSFGKSFNRMKTQYDYNLSRIYELVINSDPCYAFLLDGNTLIQNKLVAAHVYGHCDFFKNNAWFRHTSKNMVESMARNAQRIDEYEYKYGRSRVEEVLDAALAIQEHIEPRYKIGRGFAKEERKTRETPYDDLWFDEIQAEETKVKRFPEEPEKDILGFIADNAKELEDWERDILYIVREEMLYFWPQVETKIMNEGWASYWHARIMREIDLDEDETIEFAKMNASIITPSKTSINPYYVGLKMWEDIEKRWDSKAAEHGDEGRPGAGRRKMFEIRANENDLSFIRNYLTKELVEELNLYVYQKVYTKWQVVDTEWEKVREGLVALLVNGGHPYLVVEDGNYNKNGEIYIHHAHDGRDLDLYYLEKTIPHVYRLWGRKTHLETVVEGKGVLYTFAGEKIQKKVL